jgi:hypothetical protein
LGVTSKGSLSNSRKSTMEGQPELDMRDEFGDPAVGDCSSFIHSSQ